MSNVRKTVSLSLSLALLLSACSNASGPGRTGKGDAANPVAQGSGSVAAADTASPSEGTVQVSSARIGEPAANELGLVPVLEYHGVGQKESRWVRTSANFRKDLEWLAANGYVTATTEDMLAGFPTVPAGKKPVVLTFDDARADQFVASGVDRDGLAIPTAECAVGVMEAVSRAHPGFGHRASFYVLPSFFEEDRTAGAKLRYLQKNGYEIGNHTWTHLMMAKAPPEKIAAELERLQGAVQKHLGKDFHTTTVALPDGSIPKSPAQQAAAVGGPKGAFHHRALLLVGANPANSPFSKEFNPLRIARIQAIDSEWKHWFGRGPGEVGRTKEAFRPFVSDGDPKVVSFPAKAQAHLSRERLGGAEPHVVGEASATQVAAAAASTASPEATRAADQPTASPAAVAAPGAPASASLAAGGERRIPGYKDVLPEGGLYRDGKLFHTVRKGQSFEALANHYLPFVDAYTGRELRDQITRANHLKHPWVDPGQTLEIPGARKAPPAPQADGWPATKPVMGIYCTSTTASFDRIFKLAAELKAAGGNAVVFDVKDGPVSILSKDPKVRQMGEWDHTVNDLPKLIERLHQMGIHVIARQVLFNDPILARKRPDLAIHSKRNPGRVWLQKGKTPWVDPSQPEVQDYNLRLAKEIAASGVDEIQFDYVRFPAEGDIGDCKFTFDEAVKPKHTVITGFLQRARQELKPYKCLVGIDVFGVIAWGKEIDERHTGQRIQDMAKYVDVICPMVYPSHFYGSFDGFTHCADQPYYFISQGVERVRRKIGPQTPIRPWLQAFQFHVTNYNSAYVVKQLQAARDAKAVGWLYWNASNKYAEGFAAARHWGQVADKTPIQPIHVKGDGEAAKQAKAGRKGGHTGGHTAPGSARASASAGQ